MERDPFERLGWAWSHNGPDPGEQAIANERKKIIKSALDQLKQRRSGRRLAEVWILPRLHELSFSEVAPLMRCRVKRAQKLFGAADHAMQKLLTLLDIAGDIDPTPASPTRGEPVTLCIKLHNDGYRNAVNLQLPGRPGGYPARPPTDPDVPN